MGEQGDSREVPSINILIFSHGSIRGAHRDSFLETSVANNLFTVVIKAGSIKIERELVFYDDEQLVPEPIQRSVLAYY